MNEWGKYTDGQEVKKGDVYLVNDLLMRVIGVSEGLIVIEPAENPRGITSKFYDSDWIMLRAARVLVSRES